MAQSVRTIKHLVTLLALFLAPSALAQWPAQPPIGMFFGGGSSQPPPTAYIAQDAVSWDSCSIAEHVSTISWSHTTGGGSYRYMMVAVNCYVSGGTAGVDSIKYDGVKLSLVTKVGSNPTIEQWELVAPNSGAHTVQVWSEGYMAATVVAVTFSGVDQSTPRGTTVTNCGYGTAGSVSISRATDEWIIDAFGDACGGHLTPGPNQVELQEARNDEGNPLSVSKNTTADNMSWTKDYSCDWCMIATILRPQGATGYSIVSRDSVSWDSCSVAGGVSNITWQHTTNTSANRYMLVGLCAYVPGYVGIDSIKYDGVKLTRLSRIGTNPAVEQWELVAPHSGTHNVQLWGGGSMAVTVVAMTFNGVNQTSPHGTVATNTQASNSPTVTIPRSGNQWVVDACGDNAGLWHTPGSGQTEVREIHNDEGNPVAVSSRTTGSDMNWTTDYAGTWYISATVINPQ